MNKLIMIAGLVLLTASTAYAGKQDPVMAKGESLHADKCTSCHGTEVYTREDRRINSLASLEGQVKHCMKAAAKADWTASETDSVVEYLNTKYYKF